MRIIFFPQIMEADSPLSPCPKSPVNTKEILYTRSQKNGVVECALQRSVGHQESYIQLRPSDWISGKPSSKLTKTVPSNRIRQHSRHVLTGDFGHEDNGESASMIWGKIMILIDEQINLGGVSQKCLLGKTPLVFRSWVCGLMQFRGWTWLLGWWTLIWSAVDAWQIILVWMT